MSLEQLEQYQISITCLNFQTWKSLYTDVYKLHINQWPHTVPNLLETNFWISIDLFYRGISDGKVPIITAISRLIPRS